MPTKVVIGTSLFQIIFVAGFTTMIHASTNFSVDIVLALFLLASALAGFDCRKLKSWEWPLRLGLAALVMAGSVTVWGPAAAVAIALLVWHRIGRHSEPAAAA